MLRQLRGPLYFLFANVRFTVTVFWTVLGSIFLLSLILSMLVKEGTIFFQATVPVYIFSSIIGMWTVKNAIPYLIKLSITRKMIYLSVGIYFILFSIFNTLLGNILVYLPGLFGKGTSSGILTFADNQSEISIEFIHLGQFLVNDNFINRFIIDVVICFFLLTVMFLIGLIFYRFGLIGGFSFIGILVLGFILAVAKGLIVDLAIEIYQNYTLVLYFQLLIIAIVIYLIAFVLLRKLTLQ